MKNYVFKFILTSLALISMVSCQEYDAGFDLSKKVITDKDELFDFSTTHDVTFKADYGKALGSRTLMQIYTENPVGTTPDCLINPNIEPVYQTFTDNNGCYEGRVTLPTWVEKVWLVNSAFGLPLVSEVDVKSGEGSFVNPMLSVNRESKQRRATSLLGESEEGPYKVYPFADGKLEMGVENDGTSNALNYYSIVMWNDQYGNVRDNSIVSLDDEIFNNNTDAVKNLQRTLWGNNTSKPKGLDNSAYALGSNTINTVLKDKYTDEYGTEKKVESIDLEIVFMSEAGWYETALGYYYYKTGEAPAKAADVKKYIVLPNTSITNQPPYGAKGYTQYDAKYAPAFAGESVKLLFEKEDGTYTQHFPPGYTVGFFLIPNGFNSGNGTLYATSGLTVLANGKTQSPVFSNEAWNSNKKKFVAFSLPSGHIVYGAEDGADTSYEDDLFIVKGSPNEAIENPDIPILDPDAKTLYRWETHNHVYAFEDIWPDGGDYDLNDVVVEHERRVKFNESNKLCEIEDNYTVAQGDLADYTDGFAVQLNADWLGTKLQITCGEEDITSQVKVYDDDNNKFSDKAAKTYILLTDTKSAHGKVYTVKRTFDEKTYTKDAFLAAEPHINPFVISQYTDQAYADGQMTEIHIPSLGTQTTKGITTTETNGTQYYIGNIIYQYYPFGLDLPVKKFVPSPEGVRISTTYPAFINWVTSGGEENKDWYIPTSNN